MGQKLPITTGYGGQSLTARLGRIRNLEAIKRKVPIQLIADALIKAGHTSLDAQAKALGLSRSTAWTIVKTKHKLGRLNNETTARILANPDTPVSVRAIVQAMLSQKDVSKADEKNNSRPQKV